MKKMTPSSLPPLSSGLFTYGFDIGENRAVTRVSGRRGDCLWTCEEYSEKKKKKKKKEKQFQKKSKKIAFASSRNREHRKEKCVY